MDVNATSRSAVHWSTELVGELASMWVMGCSTSDIAKRLGVSRSSVIGKVKRLSCEVKSRGRFYGLNCQG